MCGDLLWQPQETNTATKCETVPETEANPGTRALDGHSWRHEDSDPTGAEARGLPDFLVTCATLVSMLLKLFQLSFCLFQLTEA